MLTSVGGVALGSQSRLNSTASRLPEAVTETVAGIHASKSIHSGFILELEA